MIEVPAQGPNFVAVRHFGARSKVTGRHSLQHRVDLKYRAGEAQVYLDGHLTKVHLFCLRLCYSQRFFVMAFPVMAFPVMAFPVMAFPVMAFPVMAFPVMAFP